MYIVLLGAPGSGKGTQGKLLAQRFNLAHLSTGDLFREILEDPRHHLYPKVQVVKEGKLVSDEVVNQVMENGIKNPEYQKGIIFDGYPRTTAQAQALDQMLQSMGRKLDLVIDLEVDMDVLFHRILGRRVCPQCRQVFHISRGLDMCPDCSIPLIQRDDDNEETIGQRFREYQEKTAPLRDYYRNSQSAYITVSVTDASKSPEEVQRDILGELSKVGIV